MFEKPPILGQSQLLGKTQKMDVCEHGNSKSSCDICMNKIQEDKLAEKPEIIEETKEGWKTANALSNELDASFSAVRKTADSYRESNPEYFSEIKNRRGRAYLHYAPELVKIITNRLRSVEKKKEGWKTNTALAKELGVNEYTVKRIADKYRELNPSLFAVMQIKRTPRISGQMGEHYSPELIELIKKDLGSIPKAEGGWITNRQLADELGVADRTVERRVDRYKESNPEWFRFMKDRARRKNEHYSPELVKKIREELISVEHSKDNWKTIGKLSEEQGVSDNTIRRIALKYKSENRYFRKFKDKSTGLISVHYSPELVEIITKNLSDIKKSETGWKTRGQLAKELGTDFATIGRMANKYRKSNPEYFGSMKSLTRLNAVHYSPELVEIIEKEFKSRIKPNENWKTRSQLAREFNVDFQAVNKIANLYYESNPEYFAILKSKRGQKDEHCSSQLVRIIEDELNKIKEAKAEKGWKTNGALAEELDVAFITIQSIANQYRQSNPEYFRIMIDVTGKERDHYSPELVSIIEKKIADKNFRKNGIQSLENFTQEISECKTEEARKIQKLIALFGPSSAIDILYKFRPEFQDIPVEKVKGIIADYLGDFLATNRNFSLDGVELIMEYLSEDNFREALFEALKKDALDFLNKQKRLQRNKNDQEIIKEYILQKREETSELENGEVNGIIQQLEEYYEQIFALKKPDNIVNTLKEGRTFPDTNQLINIKEIADKKKMLIADEMGLGKSASAILAKEYLGLKCGLIVAPSNVISTWEKYLSSEKDENGKQIGYFKEGLVPKILTLEKIEDLKKTQQAHDYILISQEKLTAKYIQELEKVDFDMLIVDEVHKLKNLKGGKRSSNLIKLAGKIEGEDKYLSILSGTPVPNKVEDLAMILKLLYPEDFAEISNRDLVNSLIYGELIDLRSKLLPRMQMKSLAESLEMPELTEEKIEIELSAEEKDIYEILWEEDELTASEKLQTLRKFLINPELLDLLPSTESSKTRTFNEELNKTFQSKDKVVCFFNGYIEGVIRGEQNIIQRLNLPEDVEIMRIEGEVSQAEREKIQNELKEKGRKILLLVSGQTADVGVDFSAAEEVYFYNEPWTKYDKRQQLGRVYREGLKNPLTFKTLIVKNTIEEGIRKYIDIKEKAIEKLLRGIPRTEIENRLMEKDEKQTERNLEINEELAEYYFSTWDRMMRIFRAARQMGEKNFRKFLTRYGKEYADCYTELGSRTYQGNNSRAMATLLNNMLSEKGADSKSIRILDIASGPEMLKKHSLEKYQDRIFSVDINRYHFDNMAGKKAVASFLELPIKNNSVDYCNLALALHYTKYAPSRGIYERLQVLTEINRALKVGGRALISTLHNDVIKDEKSFENLVKESGFRIEKNYSGEASSENSYRAQIVTLEKVQDISIEFRPEELSKELLNGLKFAESGNRLKDSRRIVEEFMLGEKNIKIIFNKKDQTILAEEKQVSEMGERLKSKYADIENIPGDEIIKNKFARILSGKKYILFKKLEKGEGAVIVRNK